MSHFFRILDAMNNWSMWSQPIHTCTFPWHLMSISMILLKITSDLIINASHIWWWFLVLVIMNISPSNFFFFKKCSGHKDIINLVRTFLTVHACMVNSLMLTAAKCSLNILIKCSGKFGKKNWMRNVNQNTINNSPSNIYQIYSWFKSHSQKYIH